MAWNPFRRAGRPRRAPGAPAPAARGGARSGAVGAAGRADADATAAERELVERALVSLGDRRRELIPRLAELEAQLAFQGEEADDARLQAIVTGSPLDARDHRDDERHVAATRKERDRIADALRRIDAEQDDLLDRLADLVRARPEAPDIPAAGTTPGPVAPPPEER